MGNDNSFDNLKISFSSDYNLFFYEEYSNNVEYKFIAKNEGKDIYGSATKGNILYKQNPDGVFLPLRLKETYQYIMELDNKDLSICIPSELEAKQINHNTWSFKVINYLGRVTFRILDINGIEIQNINLEIVPVKIDYEKDYTQLTEEIADFCSELLLDYASPTSLTFEEDLTKTAQTPLEQFIFIRKFCNSENLEYLLSAIKNNPDRILESEDEYKNFGTAPLSSSFYKAPFSKGQNWYHNQEYGYIPMTATATRKFDSYDTLANRFIKYALQVFENICDSLLLRINNTELTYYKEARLLKANIELFLNDSFFDEISDLTSMPINNQVLQKREGYYQIFNAFNMLDIAYKLDWKGNNKVYEGQARNIALLYEYWLVFKFVQILTNLGGSFNTSNVPNKSLIQIKSNDELLISLEEGRSSVLSLIFKNNNIKVNFYYNRTFSSNDFKGTMYAGSYSRDFRPDYSLAFFPAWFDNEEDAIQKGEVSYVHFDAKYRLTDLSSIIGDRFSQTNFEDEKKLETINTYKRGDLLKMHTYNDAIRKTIGSYVLYPGSQKDGVKYSVYDEILPGVGAFAIKPSNEDYGKKVLEDFLKDIIEFKSSQSSRYFRKDYFENIIIQSPTESKASIPSHKYTIASSNQMVKTELSNYSDSEKERKICMIGFLRMEYLRRIEDSLPVDITSNKKKTPSNQSSVYFYYYAVKDGYVYPQHKDISRAEKFYGWCKQSLGQNSRKTVLLNFEADIDMSKAELLSGQMLSVRVGGKHNGEYYYLVKLENIRFKEVKNIEELEKSYGNMAISPYSPKVIEM